MTQLYVIVVYLVALVLLGWIARGWSRGTSQDYLLASHSIGPFLLLMSLFGTTMTAFALVGSTGESFARGIGVYGMLASSSGIMHSLCFFLLGVKLWQFGKQYGYKTQVQFFRERLESDKIGLVLFGVLVALVIPYLLIGVLSAGLFINVVTQDQGRVVDGQVVNPTFEEGTFPRFFEDAGEGFAGPSGSKGGVPRHLASLVVCGVVLTYVFVGGMRGTAWANTFQTTIFMLLGIVMFYLIAQTLGGEESLLANLRRLAESVPEEKLTRDGLSHSKYLTYLLIPLSVGMFPHVFQHWLTARSASAFKLPIVMHPIFILIVWAPCVLVGVWATGSLVEVPPSVAEHPSRVLPFMVNQTGQAWLAGLLTAGVLAAIMSSLDSQFLCLGTMFTEDLVLHYGGRNRFSERSEVWIARGFIVAIVVLTYCFSLLEPPGVFDLGVWCFSGFSALFPLAVAALYWRGLTKWGAYASIVTTILLWLVLFRASDFGRDAAYAIELPLGGESYPVLPVFPLVVASTVAMVAVSLLTPRPSEETLARFFPPAPRVPSH